MRSSTEDFVGKTTAEIIEMAKEGLTVFLEDEFGAHALTWDETCLPGNLIIDGGRPEPFTVIEQWLGYKKAFDVQNTYFDGYTIKNPMVTLQYLEQIEVRSDKTRLYIAKRAVEVQSLIDRLTRFAEHKPSSKPSRHCARLAGRLQDRLNIVTGAK